jgi:putative DNA-invertase from lambdoid prophage Rac
MCRSPFASVTSGNVFSRALHATVVRVLKPLPTLGQVQSRRGLEGNRLRGKAGARRTQVLALAQARKVDVILVTELTRWGRSMLDLFHTLQDLQAWGVSLVAQTGLQFDLRSAQGKLIASLMAALAEFERDLLRERVRSGIAAARKRGVVFGRRPGQRVKADRYAPRVLKLVGEGQSYREISHRLGLSKNTILDIVKRDRAA